MNKFLFVCSSTVAGWLMFGASAEIVTLVAHVPAKQSEAAKLRRLVFSRSPGLLGQQLGTGLAAKLSTLNVESKPYFQILANAPTYLSSETGVVSANVTSEASSSNLIKSDTQCVKYSGILKCKQSVTTQSNCVKRTTVLHVELAIIRASDRKVSYLLSEPFTDETQWCEGEPEPSVAQSYAAFLPNLIGRIVAEIAPHSVQYTIRVLEHSDNLDKPSKAAFKAAIKVIESNTVEGCELIRQLKQSGSDNASVSFDLGICAEREFKYAEALSLYQSAFSRSPSEKAIALAVGRVGTLVAAEASYHQQLDAAAAADARDIAPASRSVARKARARIGRSR